MEQLLEFIGNHPILTGAFAVVVAAIIATESARLVRRWREVDTAEAIRLINREDPLVLDVSNSSDYAKAHILNAVNMPPSQVETGNQRLLKQSERPVLVYCKNGQASPQVATSLTKMGFERVHVLKGGLTQWMADNQPVTRSRSAKSPGKDKPREPSGKKSGKKNKRNRTDKGGQRELPGPESDAGDAGQGTSEDRRTG